MKGKALQTTFLPEDVQVLSRSGACVERIMKDQAEKLQTILTLLGEKRESDDMREVCEAAEEG